jgi:hypothetical protein
MKNELCSSARLTIRVATQNSAPNRKVMQNCQHEIRCAEQRTGGLTWMSDFNAEFSAGLLAFNAESGIYCRGISDVVAQEYAMEYARMLQNRAKGIDAQLPRIPSGLFEPNRNLIRSTLDRIWAKHLPNK